MRKTNLTLALALALASTNLLAASGDNIIVPKKDGSRVVVKSVTAAGVASDAIVVDPTLGTTNINGTFTVNSGPVTGGGGSGANYVKFPNAVGGTWANSSTGVAVTTESSVANIPKSQIYTTAIKLTVASSGSGYSYFNLPLDGNALNKVVGVSWGQAAGSGYVDGDLKFDVLECTDNTYVTCTDIPLSTDNTSNVTSIIKGAQDFSAQFNTSSKAYLQLRWSRVAGTGTNDWITMNDVAIGFSNVLLSPAPDTPWQTYSYTIANLSGFAYGPNGRWRRVGDSMEISLHFRKNASAGVTASAIVVPLPTPYVIDPAKLPFSNTQNESTLGVWSGLGIAGGSANKIGAVTAKSGDLTSVLFVAQTTSDANVLGTDVTANAEFSAFFTVPILGWSTPLITGAEYTEYACNSSTTGVDDTTSFAYGPAGCLVPTYAASLTPPGDSILKRAKFTRTIQPTDTLILEIQPSGTGNWMPQSQLDNGYQHGFLQEASGANIYRYGMGLRTIDNQTVGLQLGKAGTGYSTTGYASVRQSYPLNAGDRWRVKKVSSPALVGHSMASATSVGLVSSESSGTFVSSASGPATTTNVTIGYGKIGKVCTLTFYGLGATGNSTATFFSYDMTNLPAGFRPGNETYVPVFVADNGTNQTTPGVMYITTSGAFKAYKAWPAVVFTAGAGVMGVNPFSTSYVCP